MQDLGEASGGRREALGPGKAPSDGTCVEGSESAWGVEERGPQCPAQASTLLPPSSSQHRPQLPAGPAFGRCEKDFPAARESSNLASQCGSGQVLSIHSQVSEFCSALSSARAGLASLLKCFPHQGAWAWKEAELILPGTVARAFRKVPGFSGPRPASPHALVSCPASGLPSFLQHLVRAPPPSPCSVSRSLWPGRTPSALLPTRRPQTSAGAAQAPRGLALSEPVWGPAQISNDKSPLFLLTHTR